MVDVDVLTERARELVKILVERSKELVAQSEDQDRCSDGEGSGGFPPGLPLKPELLRRGPLDPVEPGTRPDGHPDPTTAQPEEEPYTGWQLRDEHRDRGEAARRILMNLYPATAFVQASADALLPADSPGASLIGGVDAQIGSMFQVGDDLIHAAQEGDPRLAARAVEDAVLREASIRPAAVGGAVGIASPLPLTHASDKLEWAADATETTANLLRPVVPEQYHGALDGADDQLRTGASIMEHVEQGDPVAQRLADRRRDVLPMPWDDLPARAH